MITLIKQTINKTHEKAITYLQLLQWKDEINSLEHTYNQLTKKVSKLTKQSQLLSESNQTIVTNSLEQNNSQTHKLLTDEINRLQNIVKSYQKRTSVHMLDQFDEPEMIKSATPVSFLKNFLKLKHELMNYEQKIINKDDTSINLILENEPDLGNAKLYKTDYMQENPSYLQIGDKIRRYYYLADIPAFLSPYLFFKLLNSSIPFAISIFIEPATSSELLKKARQRLSVLEMQQNERLKNGKIRDQQIDKNIDEVASFIEELIHEVEKGVIYSLYLQISADSEFEIKNIHKQLQNITSSMDVTLNQCSFDQVNACKNFVPANIDHLRENRVLQSSAAAYLLPFVSKQLHDPDGIFMGVNAYNDSLTFIDPFTSRNNNCTIFGVSGSGKSVTSKLLMSRLHLRGIQNIVIDPEGEYVSLAQSLGGEVISFNRDNGINPFYVSSSQESDILDHISTLKTFFKFFIPNNHFDNAYLDEKLMTLYNEHTPNFDNLFSLIKEHPMANDLKVLSSGSLKGIFNSKRNLELNNEIIVMDLHDLKKDEKREPAMYLLTSLIWNLINSNNNQKRMIFIDEAHKLLTDPDVATFYRELVKQARKRNTGIVSITQDVEDFLNSEHGKAIITNSETKFLLKQSYAALDQIGSIYAMTDEEKLQLGHLQIGEVIMVRENEHVRLHMLILPYEQNLGI